MTTGVRAGLQRNSDRIPYKDNGIFYYPRRQIRLPEISLLLHRRPRLLLSHSSGCGKKLNTGLCLPQRLRRGGAICVPSLIAPYRGDRLVRGRIFVFTILWLIYYVKYADLNMDNTLVCITKTLRVREWTMPNERPPFVGDVRAKFCAWRVPRGQSDASLRPVAEAQWLRH
jgi:hypothetical protein